MTTSQQQSLSERREALETRVRGLQAAKGSAMLDGREFDNDALRAAQEELEAIEAAGVEAARRQRNAAAVAAEERRHELQARFDEAQQRMIAAIGKAEKATRNQSDAIGSWLSATRELETIAPAIGMKTTKLAQRIVAKEIGHRISAVLKPVVGGTLGDIALSNPIGTKAGDNWVAAARAEMAKILRHAQQHENGKDLANG